MDTAINPTNLHHAVAFSLHTLREYSSELVALEGVGEDLGGLSIAIDSFATKTTFSALMSLVALAVKYDILDLGLLETIWANHLPPEQVRSLSQLVTKLTDSLAAASLREEQ